MTSPYREGTVTDELHCPRCEKPLPPLDVADCTHGCGVWVSAFAASEVFRDGECVENHLTRWWRVRAPCPMCSDQMTLRGQDPALHQGCDVHGFWVDADTIGHTGLSRGNLAARVQQKRDDTDRSEAERSRLELLGLERAREREASMRADERLDEAMQRSAEILASQARYDRIARALPGSGPLIAELMRLDAEVRELKERLATLERGRG